MKTIGVLLLLVFLVVVFLLIGMPLLYHGLMWLQEQGVFDNWPVWLTIPILLVLAIALVWSAPLPK